MSSHVTCFGAETRLQCIRKKEGTYKAARVIDLLTSRPIHSSAFNKDPNIGIVRKFFFRQFILQVLLHINTGQSRDGLQNYGRSASDL